MKGLVTVGLLAGLLLFAAPKRSEAGNVHFSVGVGLPGFGAVVTSGPPYGAYPGYGYGYAYGPPAVYVPAPVYYPYYPRYRHYHGHYHGHGRHYGHGRGHRYRRY